MSLIQRIKNSLSTAAVLLLLVVALFSCNAKKQITIGITLSEGLDTSDYLFLKKELSGVYNADVQFLPSFTLPDKAYYAPRNRFKASVLLDELLNLRPANIDYIMGITDKDISTTKNNVSDYGIMGLARVPGKSCIVSTFRIQHKSTTTKQLQERLAKVCLHELGHDFGLPHCPSKGCVMQDAKGTIKTVDASQKIPCEQCRAEVPFFIKKP